MNDVLKDNDPDGPRRSEGDGKEDVPDGAGDAGAAHCSIDEEAAPWAADDGGRSGTRSDANGNAAHGTAANHGCVADGAADCSGDEDDVAQGTSNEGSVAMEPLVGPTKRVPQGEPQMREGRRRRDEGERRR